MAGIGHLNGSRLLQFSTSDGQLKAIVQRRWRLPPTETGGSASGLQGQKDRIERIFMDLAAGSKLKFLDHGHTGI
jgi:hypothetical protein